MDIPIIISDLFCGIDITRYFKIDDLRFILNLTAYNYKLDECVYLNREYIFYKILAYIEYGAMGDLSHDTGERYVIGILVEVVSFNNQNHYIDPSLHDGIISVRIDADSANSNDNHIAKNIIKTKEDISDYLGNGNNIKLA